MQVLEESLRTQKGLGLDDKDIDDVRRLITDTNVILLAVTILASVLHLLFEFLAFQSDVSGGSWLRCRRTCCCGAAGQG